MPGSECPGSGHRVLFPPPGFGGYKAWCPSCGTLQPLTDLSNPYRLPAIASHPVPERDPDAQP